MKSSKEIREIRCEDLLSSFLSSSTKHRCVFFTLTTPDVVDYETIRSRWRDLRHYLVQYMIRHNSHKPKYVMNYELHPKGHGWHIHSVWDCYIDLKKHLDRIHLSGFGRVDVRVVQSYGIASYLSKHCLKAYRGLKSKDLTIDRLRLINCSRGLPRLSDYRVLDSFTARVSLFRKSALKFGYLQFTKLPFHLQWRVCEVAVLMGCQFPSQVSKNCIDILNGDFDIEKKGSNEYERFSPLLAEDQPQVCEA